MKLVVVEEFINKDNTLSAKYFPENNHDDFGYIKISSEGEVLDSKKTKLDKNNEEYFKIVKLNLITMFHNIIFNGYTGFKIHFY